ncbi:hypothetical protein C8A00DRAFT_30128 [Chaetomidium leptoderma]|uniref:Uncharacterized protein n=1 Tax=Chaetomidium leptoderma TaxID=669021 RepID=A0AAN6VT40_9PEZI|nr:hypothetical protein C8A00DRAFT_30128 [Chaetomidium leptoderma]
MLPKFITLSIAALAGPVSAAVLGPNLKVAPLQARDCNGETAALFCYTEVNGAPQKVNVTDVAFIAKYLRAYGRQIKPGRFFTMNAADTQGCGEWSAYSHRSTLVTIKHINDTVDSSVLFEDIATAIDGGEKATPEQQQQQKNALLGCGTDGGAFGVQANLSNPAYSAESYVAAGYSMSGLLVKVVSSTQQSAALARAERG